MYYMPYRKTNRAKLFVFKLQPNCIGSCFSNHFKQHHAYAAIHKSFSVLLIVASIQLQCIKFLNGGFPPNIFIITSNFGNKANLKHDHYGRKMQMFHNGIRTISHKLAFKKIKLNLI